MVLEAGRGVGSNWSVLDNSKRWLVVGWGQQQIWREGIDLGYFLVILQMLIFFTRLLPVDCTMLGGVHGKHKHCLKEIRKNISPNLDRLTNIVKTNEKKRKHVG